MADPNHPATHLTALDAARCERARLSRDARFDGLFFTAVRSTGIYCRPVCPAPAPKPNNVHYYPTAAAAEHAGYRPCLRCRPELSPGDSRWRPADDVLGRALRLIDGGALAESSVGNLATQLDLSERQLRRLFVEHLGATPNGVHNTRRLLFAKQLLSETTLPITEIALASGYRSLRRFHACFLEAYRMPPRALRRAPARGSQPDDTPRVCLRLNYRPPYDFHGLLAFLRTRALPGVEQVDAHGYARVIEGRDPAWWRIAHGPGDEPALRLEIGGVGARDLLGVVGRVRRMFDLDADPDTISLAMHEDALLRNLRTAEPGLRMPGAWDGFELAVRAVLGQQISVAAARTLALRLLDRFGLPVALTDMPALTRRFPTPATLAEADLGSIGLTRARADTLRGLARAVLDGRLRFDLTSGLDAFVEACCLLPGIGPWTAHYIALRGLGHPDAFPAADLILRRAAADGAAALTASQLGRRAEAWRPWRGYAVFHLWRHASTLDVARSPR